MEGRRKPPPSAVLLGFRLVEIDPEAGTIEVSFTATEQFLNPAGHIQGGFLAAMLDDTLGPALVATLPDGQWAPTIDPAGSVPGACATGRVPRPGARGAPRPRHRLHGG
jgi:acyl-coenzyme A thioesterase PaaI-like protein